ncbi:putative acyltransferase [Synechococcus sp. PCC 7502]|uniref:GNAT family N-acetyltransferase n=1 Tax=Synechococcus sp. PCC 7502 TaxID=1173263 RepID=UPI00029FB02B|nr:GNAT family N-acetyltransferase [Synechococcus sp. PCC 7502]AFY74427.1 putative acyltransferase [Synechococcus sp. PCC 7502]
MEINWYWQQFSDISGEEMHEILSLRQKVFVVEQRCAYLDADELDKQSWHLLGRRNDRQLIAYARLNFPNTRYSEPSFGRVITTKEIRGIGAGRRVVKACIEKSTQEYPDLNIQISAQTYLVRFYQEFGFTSVGVPYDDAGIEHVNMILETRRYLA